MTKKITPVTEPLYKYMLDNWVRQSEILNQLVIETAELELARMQISPEQGQFMSLLVRLSGALKIIEIGTFTGYSALAMASALPDNGTITCCDLSEEWTAIARKYWQKAGVSHKVKLILGPARKTLDELLCQEAGSYDMAFIDADKENYQHYYEQCLRLLKPGGVILIDNVFWGGTVMDRQVLDVDTVAIREINEFIHNDQRVDIAIVPVGDGLSMARKK